MTAVFDPLGVRDRALARCGALFFEEGVEGGVVYYVATVSRASFVPSFR